MVEHPEFLAAGADLLRAAVHIGKRDVFALGGVEPLADETGVIVGGEAPDSDTGCRIGYRCGHHGTLLIVVESSGTAGSRAQ